MKKAVILLSGGIDSATCGVLAKSQGFSLYALSFAYGQRHAVELTAAKRVADFLAVEQHHVVTIDLAAFGGSSLTSTLPVPKSSDGIVLAGEGIPNTYVPARNTIFLSFALGYAEVVGSTDIFIGVTAVDYSGYPDCRPEYIAAFCAMANLATKAAVSGNPLTIHTPLISLSKAAIITAGSSQGLDYAITHSCYDPLESGAACGLCDSCVLRKRGFLEANIPDPTTYR